MSDIDIKIKCCGNCDHGREKITAQLQKTIVCEAMPPTPIAIPIQTPQGLGLQIKNHWPVMDPSEKCGTFCPKSGKN